MSEICFLQFQDIQVIQFILKKWLPVEIIFSVQDSAEYPVIFKHCPHISKCLKNTN